MVYLAPPQRGFHSVCCIGAELSLVQLDPILGPLPTRRGHFLYPVATRRTIGITPDADRWWPV
jgi:hypothetical protein